MRALHTNDWPSLIPNALNQLNSRPLKKLNGLAPKDFNTPFDDVKLEHGSSANDPQASSSNSVQVARANQRAYEENTKELQVGDMVYADKKPASTFAKSFAPKVSFLSLLH